jgi:putative ABC transport system substrate-binding protein
MTRRLLLLTVVVGIVVLLFSSGPRPVRAADAQQVPRHIGVVLVAWSPAEGPVQEFRRGLREAGYIEGQSVVIEWQFASGDYDKVPGLVADLVQRKVDVIVVESTLAAKAAIQATSSIPIVMAVVGDPVGSGLVANLAHPGGNVTGLSLMTTDLSAKRLQLFKEAIPQATRVAVLWDPDTPWHKKAIEELNRVAPSLSIKLRFLTVRQPADLNPAFSAIGRWHAEALYVMENAFFAKHRKTILALASKDRLPVFGEKGFTDEGGLMSYGPNFGDLFHQSAGYVDKILKGTKPGDLPIEQPTKFELVVNLKTAKALGLTIPESVLLQADVVIR